MLQLEYTMTILSADPFPFPLTLPPSPHCAQSLLFAAVLLVGTSTSFVVVVGAVVVLVLL